VPWNTSINGFTVPLPFLPFDPLEGTEGLLETVGFLRRQQNVCDVEQVRSLPLLENLFPAKKVVAR